MGLVDYLIDVLPEYANVNLLFLLENLKIFKKF